ncbi:MAG: hypothetical protein JKY61_07615 [Planctomycetes bacterium]|nr:hypothetical protein [Planctomycetota bacterium]
MYRSTLALLVLVILISARSATGAVQESSTRQQAYEDLLSEKATADKLLKTYNKHVSALWEIEKDWPEYVACESCVEALCSEHLAGDDAALLKANSEWPKASDNVRLGMILTLGKSSSGHHNRGNKEVLTFLVEVINTAESWHLRSAAMLAIGHQPNAADSLDDLKAHLLKRGEPFREARKAVSGAQWGLRRMERINARSDNQITQIETESVLIIERMRLTPLLAELVREAAQWGALVTTIGRCKSPEASKQLLELAQEYPKSGLPIKLQQALLETITQVRFEYFVDRFKTLEKEIKDITKEIKKVEKRKMPRPPKGYKGTAGMWAQSSAYSKLYDIEVLTDRQDAIAEQQFLLHETLSAFAEEQTLKLPKLKKRKFHACWKSFNSSNRRSWPRSLGE